MIVDGIEKLYREYINQKNSRWEFGNGILYRMCEENPLHNDQDVVVGKLWLIGRSYAAAIERRKKAVGSGDDFYYDEVAPKMIEIGSELDDRLSLMKQFSGKNINQVSEILSIHKFLMDTFNEVTGLEKRSLASKYLHFHSPDMFFIYDSRARSGINKFVKRPDKKILLGVNSYDEEYGDFVCRMLELQEYLNDRLGEYQSPRKLDGFLLSSIK